MSAFSNGTEWDAWSANWCDQCLNDQAFREGKSDLGCPIILTAMTDDLTPVEWHQVDPLSLGGRYVCTEFKAADTGEK